MELIIEKWRRHLDGLKADKQNTELVIDIEDENEEFKAGDEVNVTKLHGDEDEEELFEDDEFPSVKKARRQKAIGKPNKQSWTTGADELALGGLSKGIGEAYRYSQKDNETLWEDHIKAGDNISIDITTLEIIITKIIRELMGTGVITEAMSSQQVQALCNRNGYSTLEQFLNRQNAYVLSSKGDLKK